MTTPKPATPTPLQQAIALHKAGDLPAAGSAYQTLLKDDPDNANILQLLGAVRAAEENYNEAIALMEKSLAINPNQVHVWCNIARSYKRHKLFEKAQNAYQKATLLDPTSPESFNGLGVIAEIQGDLNLAIKHYAKAVEIKPLYLTALQNLGHAYLKLKRYPEAESYFTQALRLKPRGQDLINALGTTQQRQRKLAQAKSTYLSAIAFPPEYGDTYCNLCFCCYEMQDYESAIEYGKKAVALIPHSALAHNNYSIALQSAALVEEAEKQAAQAIACDPNYAEAYNSYGNSLGSQGKNDEARTAYENAIRVNPRYAQAYRNYSTLKKFSAADTSLIGAMETFYHAPSATEHDRMHLGFALGKAYEDLKDYEKSFSYYAEGNRIRRKEYQYSTPAIAAYFGEIKTVFSKEFIRSAPRSGITDTTPIFILGMPRSGTTLVEQILASHPNVHGAEELNYLGHIANRFAPKWFGSAYPDFLNTVNTAGLDKIGTEYLQKLRQHSADAPHITDKMPANFQYIGLIRLALPHAKIIHCKRNPMDNCFSIYKHYFAGSQPFSYNLTDLGEYYLQYESLMKHWHEVFPGEIWDVEYETMISDTESTVTNLLKYCELPWNDACLSFHENTRTVRTASLNQVRKPIYKSSVEAWRRYETHLAPLEASLSGKR